MAASLSTPANKVNLIPPGTSLVQLLSSAPPGTLFVTGSAGGVSVEPEAHFDVVFGRNEPEVHVCIGADDPYVSRRQGYITRQRSQWILNNTGTPAIRYPQNPPILKGHHAELSTAYVPLFIVAGKREHLLEVRIATGAHKPLDMHEAPTLDQNWDLTDDERLVLVSLGQRYLRRESLPQPMVWVDVAAELAELRPAEHWNWRRAARVVERVREKLSHEGVHGLREDEVPRPIGNALNHNLIMELTVNTTTLTPDDLTILGTDEWRP